MAPNNNKENEKTGSTGKKKRTSKVRPIKKNSPKAFEDSISKSKQLIQKNKGTRALRTGCKVAKKKEPELRLCGNGKPMPSLAELEKMFEDDTDEEVDKPSVAEPARCKTPDQPIIIDDPITLTPCTIEKISNKMLEYFINLTDDAPPLPVVPQKRRKRKILPPQGVTMVPSEAPELKIPSRAKKSRVGIGKSHESYGVNYSLLDIQDSEDTHPETSDYRPLSQSIFNPKSGEISQMFKDQDMDNLSVSSGDSNKTVPYELTHSPTFMSRSFSPLPSTSTDTETIMKNEALLNESLKCVQANKTISSPQDKYDKDNDVIVVPSLPCETVIIDDEHEQPYTMKNDTDKAYNDVEEVKIRTLLPATIISAEDDIYSTIIIDDDYQPYDKDDCEIIDIDEVIASNKNFISKYKDDSATITRVIPSVNPSAEKITTNTTDTPCGTPKTIQSALIDFFINQITNTSPHYTSTELVNQLIELVGNENISNIQKICDSLISCANSLQSQFSNQLTFNSVEVSFFSNLISNSIKVLHKSDSVVPDISDIQKSLVQAYKACNTNQNTSNISTIELDSSTLSVQTNNDSITVAFPAMPPVAPDNIMSRSNTNLVASHQRKKRGKKNISQNCTATSIQTTPVRISVTPSSSTPISLISPAPHVPNSPAPVRSIGECPICMDNLGFTSIASTICGHIFCTNCIKEAVRANGKKCPTCRKKLTGVGFHPLFL